MRAVQWPTRAEDRTLEPRLDTLKPHTAPYPLPPLKMKDVHHLLRLLCPTGAMDHICPAPDAEELAAAELFQLDLIAILNQMRYLLHGLAEMEELVWD